VSAENRLATMAAKKTKKSRVPASKARAAPRERVRVFFHKRGEDPESAWCTPLAAKGHYRLDNILFFHARPIYDDVVQAAESERFDGQLTFQRIVREGGRFAMIVDYASAEQRGPLGALLQEKFDVVSEGAFGPANGKPGRLYLAVPRRFTARTVFAAAAAEHGGLVAVHPAIRLARTATVAEPPQAKPAKASAAAAPTLFDAIRTNDLAAFSRAKRADLAVVDDRRRPLLFLAVLEGRTAIVERLIALGAELNPKQFAPLWAAAMRERPKEAKALIAAGAKPELARDKDGDPALVTAAFRENVAVLRVLLAVPHSVAMKSLALLEAAGLGNLAIVKLLVKHGADPTWKSSRGNSAASIARKRKRPEVVAYFKGLG
jgi:hypothetical protein